MIIANINITRVTAHEVVRASQIIERPPVLSDELVALDEKGSALVARRLTDTVASGSHCVDVSVEDSSKGSTFDKATAMLDADDIKFLSYSQQLASDLSSAQTAGAIKSGSALFVQGTCMADNASVRFLAIIKADSDQALYKGIEGEKITLTYVSDMVLGESQRLIKIAFFIEALKADHDPIEVRSPDDFSVKVFDHLMQRSGNGEAAEYFYRTFLKCSISPNAANKTKSFFDFGRSFIDEIPLSQSERVEYHSDLISYMRDNRATIEPRTFAQDILPEAQQDLFVQRSRNAGFTEAFSKDTSLLKSRLRRQSIKFSSNVTLFAPADTFRNDVKILGTSEDGWTEVKIRGTVEEA